MRSLPHLLLILATVLACGSAFAGMPEFVFPTSPAAGRQFPGLDRMSDGTLVLVYAERTGSTAKMFVCTSVDDGVTWSHPRTFATVQAATLGLQRRPRVQIDRDGVLHAVFEDLRGSQTIHVYHCKSTDAGLTWTMPTPVAEALVSPHEDFCSAAIDSSNRLVVTFLSEGIDATDALVHVYMVTSDDKGASWSSPIRVDRFASGGSCECCQQNVAISPTGEIAVGFRSNISNRRDVHVSISADNGATFRTPVAIQSQPWNVNQCPTTGPTLCYDDNDMLHVSWWDARDATQKAIAYYAQLAPGQSTTPLNIDLSSELAMEAEYPSVATSSDGMNVVVSFLSSTGTYLMRSANGGQSFLSEKIEQTFMNNSSAFSVWTRADYPLTMWQATRESVYDILQYRDGPTSVDEASDNTIEMYVDAGGMLHVQAEEVISTISITDIIGREIVRTSPISNIAEIVLPTTGLVVIQVQLAGEPLRYRCEVFSLYR